MTRPETGDSKLGEHSCYFGNATVEGEKLQKKYIIKELFVYNNSDCINMASLAGGVDNPPVGFYHEESLLSERMVLIRKHYQ